MAHKQGLELLTSIATDWEELKAVLGPELARIQGLYQLEESNPYLSSSESSRVPEAQLSVTKSSKILRAGSPSGTEPPAKRSKTVHTEDDAMDIS